MKEGGGFRAWVRGLHPHEVARLVASMPLEEARSADREWPDWAHEGQLPPAGDWATWVIMAGRGFGKTLAGAQWIRAAAMADGSLRAALVAATLEEARQVMVEGETGLLSIAEDVIAEWSPSRRLLRFTSGAEARLFSGASPGQLRGPQHHLAWCDELAKWEKAAACWEMLQLGLRLGERPRTLVTTTPRPGPVLRAIMAEPGTMVMRGSTFANPHLPPAFTRRVESLYAGTRLGRQELDGELLSDSPGALWTVDVLERCRVASGTSPAARPERRPEAVVEGRLAPALEQAPLDFARDERGGEQLALTRIVIGVDPPSGDGTCGIVACAKDEAGRGHVLADHSVAGLSPEGWARAVSDAVRIHGARLAEGAPPPLVAAETNQGGRMVESVLRGADPGLHVRRVTATVGKSHRAEPVARLFEAGDMVLHGRFPELEAQLLGMIAGGGYEGPGASPDRADAMVWALTELMLKGEKVPHIRGL